MKIVTYNVNGLRPRISQFGSLRKLLDSLNADIICFQETKLSKQELKADMVWADGYESFFSCTRTSDRGRTGYSGVATFCRVESAFSSNEVALPLDAEEGFTGLLENSRGFKATKDASVKYIDGLEGVSRDELLTVDSEGRCIITDHGQFVLFNIYGPRAVAEDAERIQFKLSFFKILQRRWESLMLQGRRIIVVGDFNIAPSAMDRCDAGPDFENNEFRRWFRSLLVESGGSFIDVFRAEHPERTEAYTCWSTSTGAEIFNFGSRIDHILCAGSCLHENPNLEGHSFLTCHVKECDILTQFKRWKPGNTTSHRWKEGRSIKLEGSDHAPVFLNLMEIPNIVQHNTPSLSARYCPQVQGCQQTLVSMLARRQSTEEVKTHGESSPFPDEEITERSCNQRAKRSIHSCTVTSLPSDDLLTPSSLQLEEDASRRGEGIQEPSHEPCISLDINQTKALPHLEVKKKPKESQWSQLSLRSYFKRSSKSTDVNSSSADTSLDETNLSSQDYAVTTPVNVVGSSNESEAFISVPTQRQGELDAYHSSEKEKKNVALLEWQRIQQLMQNSIPICKGHNEPCVVRVVKKSGPTSGRRFYVCARGEGPASNPEANCGYFKWADSRSKHKGK